MRKNWSTAMNSVKPRLAALGGLAVTVVVGVAVAGGFSHDGPAKTSPPSVAQDRPTHVAASAPGGSPTGATVAASQTAAPAAGLVASFAAMRRPVQAEDRLPATSGVARAPSGSDTPQGQYGIKPELGRIAGRPGGAPVWLVPGATGVCIVLSDGAGGCGPALGKDGAERVGMFTVLVPVNGGPPTVQGVLPDGATIDAVDKNGKTVQGTEVSGQAYSLPAGTASFTLHLKDGTTDTNTLPTATPPAAP
jgi:hypothetical protein